MRIRTISASVLAVAAAITTAGCVAPADTSVEPPNASAGQKAKKTSKTAGIGQPAKDGKFTFTVTKVTTRSKVGNEFLGKTAQGKFVVVYVTVANHADEPQSFFGDNQKLLAGGKTYSASTEAAMYVESSASLYEEINPGNKVRGIVLFDVPKTVTPSVVQLHDSAFSGGVRVNLKSR